ncbi:MAG: hypothetical protein ACTHJ3_05355 [Pararhizobium sp.]
MAQESMSTRWSNYRPSKALWFWSCIVCIAATMIIGFTAGGWVTGGTAKRMAETAAQDGRTKLAATVCVDRFVASADPAAFAKLKAADSWDRGDIVAKGGWAKIEGVDGDIPGVADACAKHIAAMDALPASATGTPAGATTAATTTEQNG